MPTKVAFVGGGFACWSTICSILECIEQEGLKDGHEISIFEKTAHTYTGRAYSPDLPDILLLQNRVAHNAFADEFADWVLANENPNHLSREQALASNLPRKTYGTFLKQKFLDAEQQLRKHGVKVATHACEITSIRRVGEGYALGGGKSEYQADCVVLAMGLLGGRSTKAIVDNERIFAPSSASLMGLDFRMHADARVGVIGFGPAAFDALRIITRGPGRPKYMEVFDKNPLVASADFAKQASPELFSACRQLARKSSFTGTELYRALLGDHQRLMELGHTAYDLFTPFNYWFHRTFSLLRPSDQEDFMGMYSGSIRRLTARNIRENLELIRQLLDGDGLIHTPEHVRSVVRLGNRVRVNGAHDFDYVVDASFKRAKITESPDAFIKSLLAVGAQPSYSNLGFKVDEDLRAAPNIYVIGPLLAGNIVSGLPVIGVESTARIAGYSRRLAQSLLTP